MIKVKTFYVYKDSFKNLDAEVEKYLTQNKISKNDIISIIPLYSQNMLGSTVTAGITIIYSKQ